MYGQPNSTPSTLGDLLYQDPYTVEDDPRRRIADAIMLAQAPKNKAYWDYRLKMNDFETPDEELFRRANSVQPSSQPASQGGGYKTGSDYVAPRQLTEAEIQAWRKRMMEEAANKRGY